jgi:acyl dehydratase
MPELNKATIGKQYPPMEMEIEQHETIYYAVGSNDPNPWYLDGTRPGGLIAPPMYAVKVGAGPIAHVMFDKEIGEGFFAFLVHGEQEIEWFKVMKPGMKIKCQGRIASIEDKGTGELIQIESNVTLAATGEPLCREVFNFFVRGYGKMEKKAKVAEPPEDRSKEAFNAKEHVLIGQTFLYAEPSGDHNPIHVNVDFANKVGLGGIILQGLCSMAFCHKAVVQNVCGGDPTKLKKFFVRFSKPVRPGDDLTIKGWWINDQTVGFEAMNQKGESVIKGGLAYLGSVSA